MRILVFGGSFNPPHIGHLVMADHARRRFGYDLVVFVPAFSPPHKVLQDDPGPDRRLAMLELSCAGDPAFRVDSCEIDREGPSYTIDTLVDLMHRMHPDGKPGLLLGDDLSEGFTSWRRSEDIASIADILRARRSEGSSAPFPYPHRMVDNPVMRVSSSSIRAEIATAGAFRYLLHPDVYAYILREGLYGSR